MKEYTVERFFHKKVSNAYNYYIFIGALHFMCFLKVFHSIHSFLSNSSAEGSCSPQHPHMPVMPKTMSHLRRVHLYLQHCIRRDCSVSLRKTQIILQASSVQLALVVCCFYFPGRCQFAPVQQ